MYPNISDGIVLTGFSLNGSFTGFFGAGADFQQANLNQPFRFGNVTTGQVASVLNLMAANVSSAVTEAIVNAYGLTDYIAGLTPGSLPQVQYVNGYLANSNVNSQQYLFFLPGFFDTGLLYAGEMTKQPVTVGELLTLSSVPMANAYAGPVLIVTGCEFSITTSVITKPFRKVTNVFSPQQMTCPTAEVIAWQQASQHSHPYPRPQ